MVNTKKFITTKYLSAKNIGALKGTKHIINAAFSEVINDEDKLLIRLSDIDTPMVLNQTNLNILCDAWGDDTDEWINNAVVINVVKVTFNGSVVDGLQLSPIETQKKINK